MYCRWTFTVSWTCFGPQMPLSCSLSVSHRFKSVHCLLYPFTSWCPWAGPHNSLWKTVSTLLKKELDDWIVNKTRRVELIHNKLQNGAEMRQRKQADDGLKYLLTSDRQSSHHGRSSYTGLMPGQGCCHGTREWQTWLIYSMCNVRKNYGWTNRYSESDKPDGPDQEKWKGLNMESSPEMSTQNL